MRKLSEVVQTEAVMEPRKELGGFGKFYVLFCLAEKAMLFADDKKVKPELRHEAAEQYIAEGLVALEEAGQIPEGAGLAWCEEAEAVCELVLSVDAYEPTKKTKHGGE